MPYLEYPDNQVVSWDCSDANVAAVYGDSSIVIWRITDAVKLCEWQMPKVAMQTPWSFTVPDQPAEMGIIFNGILEIRSIPEGKTRLKAGIDASRLMDWAISRDGNKFCFQDFSGDLYSLALDQPGLAPHRVDLKRIIADPQQHVMPLRMGLSFLPNGTDFAIVAAEQVVAQTPQGQTLWTRHAPTGGSWKLKLGAPANQAVLVLYDAPHDNTYVIAKSDGRILWHGAGEVTDPYAAIDNVGQTLAFFRDGHLQLSDLSKNRVIDTGLGGQPQLRFTPDGSLLLALPALKPRKWQEGDETVITRRPTSFLTIIEVKTGRTLRQIDLGRASQRTEQGK